MTIEFGGVKLEAPGGAIIGVVGETIPALERFMETAGSARICWLDSMDAIERGMAFHEMAKARGASEAILLATQDDRILRSSCDEVWWIGDREVIRKGDPAEVLDDFQRHVAAKIRAAGAGRSNAVAPSLRRGDGRSELMSIDTLSAAGQPTSVWTSGEKAAIRLAIRFHAAASDPVAGIMIRTRIGFEVYGTNTELENVKLGPCREGDVRSVRFDFACDLCPGEYTITAASHDPDGVWHDWLEDAVAFSVVDARYTAGVANLRARVTVDS